MAAIESGLGPAVDSGLGELGKAGRPCGSTIEAQEQALMREERRDRALASKLVKQESKLLKSMPQMEEKLKTIAKEVNGDTVSMRARLTAKLGSMRKSLADMTNGVKLGHTVMSS